jgi:hypothetical protein
MSIIYARLNNADLQGSELLERKLATLTGAEHGQIIPVADGVLARVFDGDVIYALRFRQYPAGVMPPDPLPTNNLFVVTADGSAAFTRRGTI